MEVNLQPSIDRLNYSKLLLKNLEEDIEEYKSSNPLSIRFVPYEATFVGVNEYGEVVSSPDIWGQQGKENYVSLRVFLDKPLSYEINLAIGDILNHIKTSYDYLAAAIAVSLRMEPKRIKNLHFPSTSKEVDVDNEINKHFKGYENTDVVKKIRETQPFLHGKYRIKEVTAFCNTNKHREPISLIGLTDYFPLTFGNSLHIGNMSTEINPIIGYTDVAQILTNETPTVKYQTPTLKIEIDIGKIHDGRVSCDMSAIKYLGDCIALAEEAINSFK